MPIKAAHGQCFLLVGTSVGMTIQRACVHFLKGQLFHSIWPVLTVELRMDAKLGTVGRLLLFS